MCSSDLKGRTMLVQRKKVKEGRDSKKEEREDASIATGLATMLESVLIKGIHHEMMITTTTISREMEIKEITGSTIKEREILQLHDMEIVDLLRSQETPSMISLMV